MGGINNKLDFDDCRHEYPALFHGNLLRIKSYISKHELTGK